MVIQFVKKLDKCTCTHPGPGLTYIREPTVTTSSRWIFFSNFIIIIIFTLQYCIGFAIHQHASATGVHVFPILNPPSHLPAHTIPLGHPSAPAPSFLYPASNLAIQFLIWYYTCFNAILPNHSTPSLSHRVRKTVLYICVSFAVSHIGLSLPSF